ncbi:hypothetical protein D8675_00370 (plasmid) [Enterobacter roggenkampii]|nr:hypothetical protein D8675_00370 [Enterobacter roggenkampii]
MRDMILQLSKSSIYSTKPTTDTQKCFSPWTFRHYRNKCPEIISDGRIYFSCRNTPACSGR